MTDNLETAEQVCSQPEIFPTFLRRQLSKQQSNSQNNYFIVEQLFSHLRQRPHTLITATLPNKNKQPTFAKSIKDYNLERLEMQFDSRPGRGTLLFRYFFQGFLVNFLLLLLIGNCVCAASPTRHFFISNVELRLDKASSWIVAAPVQIIRRI